MRTVKFEHNQRLGEAFFRSGDAQTHIKDAIVWICELTGDYLVAEYGQNLPTLTLNKGAIILKTSDNGYRVGPSLPRIIERVEHYLDISRKWDDWYGVRESSDESKYYFTVKGVLMAIQMGADIPPYSGEHPTELPPPKGN